MKSLAACSNWIDRPAQWESLQNVLAKGRVRISFWGSRLIEVEGYSSSIFLLNFARRVHQASYAHREAQDLTSKERLAGVEIVKSLKKFYEMADGQLDKTSFVTRLFIVVWNLLFLPFTIYFRYVVARSIFHHAENNFLTYTPQKFKEKFGSGTQNLTQLVGLYAREYVKNPLGIVAKVDALAMSIKQL